MYPVRKGRRDAPDRRASRRDRVADAGAGRCQLSGRCGAAAAVLRIERAKSGRRFPWSRNAAASTSARFASSRMSDGAIRVGESAARVPRRADRRAGLRGPDRAVGGNRAAQMNASARDLRILVMAPTARDGGITTRSAQRRRDRDRDVHRPRRARRRARRRRRRGAGRRRALDRGAQSAARRRG